MKTIKVRKDEKTGDGYLKLDDFKDLVNISLVKSYTLEEIHDGNNMSLVLTFFNEDGDVVQAGQERNQAV